MMNLQHGQLLPKPFSCFAKQLYYRQELYRLVLSLNEENVVSIIKNNHYWPHPPTPSPGRGVVELNASKWFIKVIIFSLTIKIKNDKKNSCRLNTGYINGQFSNTLTRCCKDCITQCRCKWRQARFSYSLYFFTSFCKDEHIYFRWCFVNP